MGVESVGAVASGGDPLPRAGLGGCATALWMGSEPFGLTGPARGRMRRLVTVPMAADVDSFSVNAAAAIVLYEIRRDR